MIDSFIAAHPWLSIDHLPQVQQVLAAAVGSTRAQWIAFTQAVKTRRHIMLRMIQVNQLVYAEQQQYVDWCAAQVERWQQTSADPRLDGLTDLIAELRTLTDAVVGLLTTLEEQASWESAGL